MGACIPVGNNEPIVYEVFEEDKPSYLPSYIMSAFVVVGLVTVLRSDIPLWPPQLGHAFFAIWFGCFFVWMLRNSKNRKSFSSNRLIVTDRVFKHTFRYAIAEAEFVEISISDIDKVKIVGEQPRVIEVSSKSDFDLYVLPRNADVDALVAALKKINPSIQVES